MLSHKDTTNRQTTILLKKGMLKVPFFENITLKKGAGKKKENRKSPQDILRALEAMERGKLRD